MENYLYEQNQHWLGKKYTTGVNPEIILFANLELPAFAQNLSTDILDELYNTFLKLKSPKGKLYLFLDEIQTIPHWEIWLKYHYDLHKSEMKFYITGSNSELLSSEFATKLSGRIIEKKLYPFSLKEILRLHKIACSNNQEISLNREKILHYFDEFLSLGGMPETLSVDSVETRRELLASYFNTIIYKDIVPRFSIRNSQAIQNLCLYALENVTSILNMKKASDYLHTKRDNVRDFLHYLEQAYLNFIVYKFDFSSKTRLLSSKKSYSIDNGFVNLLPMRFSPNFGRLLENLVFLELKKQYETVYYYKNRGECDFIIHNQMRDLLAIQVCYILTEDNRAREINGLKLGCEKLGINHGSIITYNQEEFLIYDEIEVKVIPYWKWVLEQ